MFKINFLNKRRQFRKKFDKPIIFQFIKEEYSTNNTCN